MKQLKTRLLIIGIISTVIVLIYTFFIYTPKLVLNDEQTLTIGLNEEFSDPGVSVSYFGFKVKTLYSDDIVDTSISHEQSIFYKYKLFNKEVNIKRDIVVRDIKAPEITLSDNSPLVIYLGETITMDDVRAYDDVDGDLTDKIKLDGADFNRVGEYSLQYIVYDAAGNMASVSRDLTILKSELNEVDTSKQVSVLMYHYFYDGKNGEVGENSNYIDIDLFESHMQYLIDDNFYFPTWEELRDFTDGLLLLPEKSVIVTADDGQESFFRLAVPVIQKLEIPVTSFLITSNKSAQDMLEQNIKEKIEYINFQSHTHDMHRAGGNIGHGGIFTAMSSEGAIEDLETSIGLLGSADALAYPFGDYTDFTIECVEEVGFKIALTTVYGKVSPGMEPLALPRVRVNGDTSLASFQVMVE